ncbi:MAG: protoporphyrinogen oxidase [Verrucomicrobiia bacterium]
MKSVLIIGAGLSGLTAATALKKSGYSVILLETSQSPGGVAQTILKDGFRCELGPNTFLVSQPETVRFLKENDLWENAMDAAPLVKNRFVVKNEKLTPLPLNPLSLLSTPLISWQGKRQLCHGLFSSSPVKSEETIANFFRQEFGKEILQEMVDPFISGIWAGNPEQLILRHAFPKLYRIKNESKNLVHAFLKKKKTGVKRRLISWPEGLGFLSQKLASHQTIHYQTEALAITQKNNQFHVETNKKSFTSDFVILAASLSQISKLLTPIIPEPKNFPTIPQASLNVIHLGFHRAAIQHPLNGFGVLISRQRNIRTLGALFPSTLFPQRAPDNHILLTAFLGGVQDPTAIALSNEMLLEQIQSDLAPLLGITQKPTFHHIVRWPQAIPQYDIHYDSFLDLYQNVEHQFPGLYLLGNYRGGISLENVILNALKLSDFFPSTNSHKR